MNANFNAALNQNATNLNNLNAAVNENVANLTGDVNAAINQNAANLTAGVNDVTAGVTADAAMV